MRYNCRTIFLCLCLVLLIAINIVQADGGPIYKINNGDILEIGVYGEDDMTKTVQVSTDGTIAYPLIGNVKVAGMSAKEAQNEIAELLKKDYFINPQVSVFIKQYSKVLVMGQVRNPGAYELKDGLTVLGALALAGGLTDIASADQTKVIRIVGKKKEAIPVPVGSLLKGGDRSRDILLEPNDTIMVPESMF